MEELEDKILETEPLDEMLEKEMRKAEAEAARALKLSYELIKKFSKEPVSEETPQENSEALSRQEKKEAKSDLVQGASD